MRLFIIALLLFVVAALVMDRNDKVIALADAQGALEALQKDKQAAEIIELRKQMEAMKNLPKSTPVVATPAATPADWFSQRVNGAKGTLDTPTHPVERR